MGREGAVNAGAGNRMTWRRVEEDEIPPHVAAQLAALAALDDRERECWWMVSE